LVAKDTKFETYAEDGVLRGTEIRANTIKGTLGTKWRNVVRDKSCGAPRITRDGVTYIHTQCRRTGRVGRTHAETALRMREFAIGESNDDLKKKFLDLAEQYLKLVKRAEQRVENPR
jgi:chaperonin GroEL (HSP60 family)